MASITKVGGSGKTKVGGSGKTKVNPVVVPGGNITADLWQTFEGGTLDASTLQANDNNATALWTVTGAGKDTNSSAERATFSTVNSVSDTGTLGCRRDNSTATGSVLCDLNIAEVATQSVGFWFQVTALDDGTYSRIIGFGEGSGGTLIVGMSIDRAGANYTAKLYNTGAGSSSTITISAATWYWATLKVVVNGTCLLRVYNTSGSLVGSEQSLTGDNYHFYYHGMPISASTSGTGSTYMDDFVINKTTAAFPLGP